jgi:uncharacterized protein YggE
MEKYKNLLQLGGAVAAFSFALLSLVTIFFLAYSAKYISKSSSTQNTIAISGKGEVYAKPNIANISFTVRETEKNVSDAQTKVKAKAVLAVAALKEMGVEDKDIKTENYNSYPKYEYEQPVCSKGYCPAGKNIITGYDVSESVSVKVRDTEKVSAILQKIGTLNITEISGPNFEVDDLDKTKEEARSLAIKNAKEKAEKLAADLGVRLGNVVSFSENQSGGYNPMYMMRSEKAMSVSGDAVSNDTSNIQTGENKITSDVSVVYEIR